MHRRSFGVAIVSLLFAGLALGSRQPDTTAQQTSTQGQHRIVGAWFVTTLLDGQPPSPNMTSFYADGTVVTSNRPVFPQARGAAAPEARSAGHGAWVANEDGTVDFMFIVLTADVDGTFLGTRTLQGHLTLDESGNVWSAPFSASVMDPSGALVSKSVGQAEATRIKVEPMEVSGTPATG
ncbi:MAG: hypothetical protein QOF33_2322 [Thermomicrobiales bacterium]|jgi:hypothetical protein|nr:hypothetical protein [Thermomicrobiales bacterium]